jgi:hypothetical protein
MRIFAISFIIFLSSLAWPQRRPPLNGPAPDRPPRRSRAKGCVGPAASSQAGTNANAGTRVYACQAHVNRTDRCAAGRGHPRQRRRATHHRRDDDRHRGQARNPTRNGDNVAGKRSTGASQALAKRLRVSRQACRISSTSQARSRRWCRTADAGIEITGISYRQGRGRPGQVSEQPGREPGDARRFAVGRAGYGVS